MNRRLILPAVLALGLLTACTDSTTTDETPASDATTQAAELTAEQETCAGFFEGTGTPLAQRADDARTALSGGEVVDDTTYSQVNLLEQRITELGEDAPEELATILTDVNAPFTETVAAVNEVRYAEVPEGEEAPGFPDLSGIDVSGSEAAQGELETACADAGY